MIQSKVLNNNFLMMLVYCSNLRLGMGVDVRQIYRSDRALMLQQLIIWEKPL